MRSVAALALLALLSPVALAQQAKPNVLFIAVDDLNDWLGCLGGHPQAKTPNFDRLAARSVLFDNAHCPAPACNPSRTAILTGIAPNRSGLYANGQKMRDVLPTAELLPRSFTRHGYRASGAGKMLHYFIDARSWDEYFPPKQSENPLPKTRYPDVRPVSLPRAGPWQYVETDWGPLDVTDEEFGGDWSVSEWIGDKLRAEHEQPFFLACGIYRPHEPWFVPKKYFDMFPLDSVQLPQGYKADDLDDLPPSGKRRGPNRYFAHIRKHEQWRPAVRAYLASIAFADAMLGRVLDALEKGPHADDTIVVLWSDHGWHLGEKQHWQKYTAWRVCTRVPLMIRVPPGAPGLPRGTEPAICKKPVSLLSLGPTLLDLCGLPRCADHDGPSLLPLLRDPAAPWPHVAVTHLHTPGAFGLSAEGWRYIRYPNGDEELYDIRRDPFEWTNLASQPAHRERLELLRGRAPRVFAAKPEVRVASLPALRWRRLEVDAKPPVSKPDGSPFDVVFINRSGKPVEVCWVAPDGALRSYGRVSHEGRKRQQTRPGAVWCIRDAAGARLGWFRVGDRSSRAVVPER